MYKRANYNDLGQAGAPDPTTLKLQSLGMRIRKAVADGYCAPRSNGYLTEFEQQQQQQQQQQQSAPQRVPLPTHISQPPSLSYGSSSTLEGESFNERFLQNQPQLINNKRQRYDDDDMDEDEYVKAGGRDQLNNKDASIEYFENKYGSLSFNEEF